METTRNISLTMALVLAFLIFASDMTIESQARGMSEDTLNKCVKNVDCVRKWHCDSGLVPVCIDGTCICVP
ncbi:hypothetical protein RYX36_000961 [Vicia faba]